MQLEDQLPMMDPRDREEAKAILLELRKELGRMREPLRISGYPHDAPEYTPIGQTEHWIEQRRVVLSVLQACKVLQYYRPAQDDFVVGTTAKDVEAALGVIRNFQAAQAQVPASVHKAVLQMTPAQDRVTTDVFVVHGHDEEAKTSVARCLEKLKLRPVILHEQANKGRVLIEKLEAHAEVGFAVVLLTPDDEGRVRQSPVEDDLKPRARQNVVLELGYFLAKLGRPKVCALHKGDVELPSDFDGVVYVQMDPAGAWQLQLVRELKAAGFAVSADDLA